MSRYWHPHSSEKRLINDWDAFWTEGRSDDGTRGYIVVLCDPEFGDRTLCLCRDMENAQGIAESLNKARQYDKIIDSLKQACPMSADLQAALEYATGDQTNRGKGLAGLEEDVLRSEGL